MAGRVRRPRGRGPGGRCPDVVVLVRPAAADSVSAGRLLAADVAHLSVVVREAGLIVGPLVLPGAGPCLRCLDLHRTDRDPAWPRLLAQLPGRPTPADAGETASSQLGASLAALQVLAHLDGLAPMPAADGARGRARPASVGATLEVDLPDGLVSRRPWTVHPACGCSWSMTTPPVPADPGIPPGVASRGDARDVPDAPEGSVGATGAARAASSDNEAGDRPAPTGRDPHGEARDPARWASPDAPPWARQAGRRPAGRGGGRRGAGRAPPSSCSRCSASSRAAR